MSRTLAPSLGAQQRRKYGRTIARAAGAYGAIVSKIQWPYELWGSRVETRAPQGGCVLVTNVQTYVRCGTRAHMRALRNSRVRSRLGNAEEPY